jgi:hypothetical protein
MWSHFLSLISSQLYSPNHKILDKIRVHLITKTAIAWH